MIWHLDVKIVCLHWELQEQFFMQQPQGFVIKGQEHKICLFFNAIYGFKQASRTWYFQMDPFLCKNGLTWSNSNHYFYFSIQHGQYVIFIICVDDFLLTHDDHDMMFLEKSLIKSFEMFQLGVTSLHIGLEFISVQHVKLSSCKNTNEWRSSTLL
jgi:hypothetical protein